MAKQPNKVGGGAKTNEVGLHFEQTTELAQAINKQTGYKVVGNKVYCNENHVATMYPKNALYKNLLEPRNVNYKSFISKKILPDDAILVGDTLYIIEKKFQSGAGSVDEKLQTCDFKKKQYAKLLAPLNIKVEYMYFLSDWFKQDTYNDVKDYILSVGCKFFFDEIPLTEIGL